VITGGGLLAGIYIFGVLARMLAAMPDGTEVAEIGRGRQLIAFALAGVALLLGFLPLEPVALLQIGRMP